MSQQGAAMQNCNQELVRCIEDLRRKRVEVQKQIDTYDEEKLRLQTEIEKLTRRLTLVSDALAKFMLTRSEYDKTIEDTEAAFDKILESSNVLLTMVKSESQTLEETTKKHMPNHHRKDRSGSNQSLDNKERGMLKHKDIHV